MESESLSALSWSELVQRLRTLEDRSAEEERVVHDLHVHQVELEMQNRELRDAQQRLESSRARYAELYDQAPVGYLTLDESATIIEINLTGALLLGRERENLIGTPFVATASVKNPGAFFAHLRECASGRASTTDVEIATPRGPLTVQLTTKPNFGVGGRAQGCRMTMSDVTERRRAEAEKVALLENERRARAEADSANHMKDQFLGIVSHELRTPLNAILGWTQILGSRGGEPELFPRGLAVMQRNGEALARIVDDILDVSRIVSGKLRIEKKKIALDEMVTSALEHARAAAESKRIMIRSTIAPGCRVTGDAQRLQQVVSNLLSNAIKFTKDGGHIDVTLESQANAFSIAIRDDGCGIDPADLPHVFEHFRQADSSTTRTHAGLGLGLAIAHHIVHAHGGTIEGQSYGRGRGATFTVTLPSRPYSIPPSGTHSAIHSGPTAGASEGRAQGSVAGIKVLCVDDEKDGLEVAGIMLDALGADVRMATSVDEAIVLLSSFMPDIIVSDIAMPDQDGYDLIRHVRALPPPASELPAIALTAYARADDADRVVRAGFTRHLAKPVDAETLAEVISTLVPC